MPARANFSSLAPRGENGFNALEKKSVSSTSCAGSLVGGCMICDARLFREWRDWAFPRMSQTRSSTIKRGRFLEWRQFIRGTTFWLSVSKRWIVGASTSNTLCKNFVHQKTSKLQSQLQTKSVWPIPGELMKITAKT